MMLLQYLIGLFMLSSIAYGLPVFSKDLRHLFGSRHTGSASSKYDKYRAFVGPPNYGNAITLAGEYEGDMIFPDGYDPKRITQLRGVAASGSAQWPSGVVPYDLSAITDEGNRRLIEESMSTLHFAVGTPIEGRQDRQLCVQFRPRTENDAIFLQIDYGNGCSATVGHGTSDRVMTLNQEECFHSGVIQHELLHVLGFFHEQSRPDRDEFVTVVEKNVIPNLLHNFEKYTWGAEVLNLNTPYDYDSIMHYGTSFFTVNQQPTLVPKQNVVIGQQERLSAIDIQEVRAFYNCQP